MADKPKITLNRGKVHVTAQDLAEKAVQRAAFRTRDRVKANIVRSGRVNTGRMRDSIKAYRVPSPPEKVQYVVQSKVPYVGFQEFGVKGPIRPVTSKFLVFKPKGMNTFVFARQTKGFAGAHFFQRAYRMLKKSDYLA